MILLGLLDFPKTETDLGIPKMFLGKWILAFLGKNSDFWESKICFWDVAEIVQNKEVQYAQKKFQRQM